MFQGLTSNGGSVDMSQLSNGLYEVVVNGLFGQSQTTSGLNLNQALDLVAKLIGQ